MALKKVMSLCTVFTCVFSLIRHHTRHIKQFRTAHNNEDNIAHKALVKLKEEYWTKKVKIPD